MSYFNFKSSIFFEIIYLASSSSVSNIILCKAGLRIGRIIGSWQCSAVVWGVLKLGDSAFRRGLDDLPRRLDGEMKFRR